jgi:hypothetical protein
MTARIAIVQGHPDRGGGHFGNALAVQSLGRRAG